MITVRIRTREIERVRLPGRRGERRRSRHELAVMLVRPQLVLHLLTNENRRRTSIADAAATWCSTPLCHAEPRPGGCRPASVRRTRSAGGGVPIPTCQRPCRSSANRYPASITQKSAGKEIGTGRADRNFSRSSLVEPASPNEETCFFSLEPRSMTATRQKSGAPKPELLFARPPERIGRIGEESCSSSTPLPSPMSSLIAVSRR